MKQEETWDSTNGIRAFSTIYIEVTTEINPDGEYWRLISSEGGWETVDASLNTMNPTVTQGTSGMGRDELLVSESAQYIPVNVGAYSYVAPTWPPVNSAGVEVWEPLVGESSQVDVFRGDTSNSWVLNHSNTWN